MELQPGGEGESGDQTRRSELELPGKTKRPICSDGCGRPSKVCLCPYLPASPLPTQTTIFILHHPHELRRNRLATLPLLARSLRHLHLLSGRRLRPGLSPLLDSFSSSPSPVLFLFPYPSAVDLSVWAASTPAEARAEPVLILVDGTWNQAREMATASLAFLSQFATCVSLGCEVGREGGSTYESDLILKKEPFKGCMSTLEAVARALRVLEPQGKGMEIEDCLIRVLRAMVGFQALHMKPMKPRPKMTRMKDRMNSSQ